MKLDKNSLTEKDPYFKKTVYLRFKQKNLKFNTSQSLFSSHDIDLGTRHLLRTIENMDLNNFKKVLDLGSGYGPIGIAIKSASPETDLHMVDKDALGIMYSEINEKLNDVSDIKIYGSLGYYNVEEKKFDLIISNVPAKVGTDVLRHMLLDAFKYLDFQGKVFIVVIEAIAEIVSDILSNPAVKITFQKKWPGHTVIHYEFISDPNIKENSSSFWDEGIYARNKIELNAGRENVIIKTTYNLPEFDTLSFESEILIKEIKGYQDKQFNNSLFFNTGQGIIPVVSSKILQLNNIFLCDRDLQALNVTKANLELNGISDLKIKSFFQPDFNNIKIGKMNVIIGIFSNKESQHINALIFNQALNLLENGGYLITSSSSTSITRIESLAKKEKTLNILKRSKSRGFSSILFVKR